MKLPNKQKYMKIQYQLWTQTSDQIPYQLWHSIWGKVPIKSVYDVRYSIYSKIRDDI